jgi:hypothetical protein
MKSDQADPPRPEPSPEAGEGLVPVMGLYRIELKMFQGTIVFSDVHFFNIYCLDFK